MGCDLFGKEFALFLQSPIQKFVECSDSLFGKSSFIFICLDKLIALVDHAGKHLFKFLRPFAFRDIAKHRCKIPQQMLIAFQVKVVKNLVVIYGIVVVHYLVDSGKHCKYAVIDKSFQIFLLMINKQVHPLGGIRPEPPYFSVYSDAGIVPVHNRKALEDSCHLPGKFFGKFPEFLDGIRDKSLAWRQFQCRLNYFLNPVYTDNPDF